jgi:type II secretory pathway predicted ATPase ExeA
MYLGFYGMQRPPFSLHPDPQCFFPGAQHVKAASMLDYAMLRREGIVVITGDVGCGKSALLRSFFAGPPELLLLGLITNPSPLEESLIHGVMLAFRLTPSAPSDAELHADFDAFLRTQLTSGRTVMLLIDEAQHLSSTALERLRMLTDPGSEGDAALQLVLVGQSRLKQTLADPKLEQLMQRVVAQFHLGPLSPGETRAYIAHRLYAAGANRPIFSDSAIALIQKGSGGVPRLINLICDAALLYGFAEELSEIDEALIRQVMADRGLGARREPSLGASMPPRVVRKPPEKAALQPQEADREIARQLFGMSSGKK